MEKKWSEQALEAGESIYKKIEQMPFIQELKEGTLPIEKFLFYIRQDAIYLIEYGKVLAGIASKLNDCSDRNNFLHFSGDSVYVEMELHETFLKNAPAAKYEGPSPSCLLYTGFFSQMLLSYPVEVAMAAVMPCFTIYLKVGKYLLENQNRNVKNPYQSWIDTYNGDMFDKSTQTALEICDRAAEKSGLYKEMTQAYLRASQLEFMFWDSAYKEETWIIK